MDKVTILSRKRFLNWIPNISKKQVVAIRIGDEVPVEDSVSKRYSDVLALSFYDESKYAEDIERNTPTGSNRLTLADKTVIDTFIDKHVREYFVVHCEQGISRSAAVGYYILKKLGYDKELEEKRASCLYSPNIEAYGILIGKPYTKKTANELREEIKNIPE